jgi:nanoRNase/pAp phosphatase (c-di-AMP/oligoRNAs hydrolase)
MSGRFGELVALLRQAPGRIFIQTHDVPDPDAIAAAHGLRYILEQREIATSILYDRAIDKADSRKMIELFHIELLPVSAMAGFASGDWTVLVDAQKGNANIRDLPSVEVAAIDHHELRDDACYQYMDIRPEVGSCSSIIASYFIDEDIAFPTMIATALMYGIFVDTDNLSRAVSNLDAEMFNQLHRFSDPELIKRIRGSQITLTDLRVYAEAFRTVEIYGPIGFLRLENASDGLIGAASDIVLSLEGVDIAIAYSMRPGGVKLSARSINPRFPASTFIKAVVDGLGFGGGHAHMAGGFMPDEQLPKDRSADTLIKFRTIRLLESQVE